MQNAKTVQKKVLAALINGPGIGRSDANIFLGEASHPHPDH